MEARLSPDWDDWSELHSVAFDAEMGFMYIAFGFVSNNTEVKEVAESSTTAINTLNNVKKRSTTKYIVVGILLSQYMAAPLYSASTYLFRFRQHAQEFEADAFAVELGHAVPLIELLVRLHATNDAVGSDVLYDACMRHTLVRRVE